jgi:hypothetical protein
MLFVELKPAPNNKDMFNDFKDMMKSLFEQMRTMLYLLTAVLTKLK